MCGPCYTKWLKENAPKCKIEGCHNPFHAKDLCRNCYDKELKKKNPEYKERQRHNHSKWRENNPEKYRDNEERQALNRRTVVKVGDDYDDTVRRNKAYQDKYGIDIKEYERMLSEQNNQCCICGANEHEIAKQRLYIDHDHKTGQIRGLLCSSCNLALGHLEKILYNNGFASAINSIAEYLEVRKECQKDNKMVKNLTTANRSCRYYHL
jgi:hypothetical protein